MRRIIGFRILVRRPFEMTVEVKAVFIQDALEETKRIALLYTEATIYSIVESSVDGHTHFEVV